MKKNILITSAASAAIIAGITLLIINSAKKKTGCSGICAGCSGCGKKLPSPAYYVQKEKTLKKELSKKEDIFKPALRKYYQDAEIQQIITETNAQFNLLIPAIPYIGGDENPRTEDIENAAMVLAFYKVQKEHGKTTNEIGRMIDDSIKHELQRYPGWLLHMTGSRFFSKKYKKTEKENAIKSQKRMYPYDWVTDYIEGDKKTFDYGCNHYECGIYKYLTANQAHDLVPYLCKLDYLYSDAFGEVLVRTSTIAENGTICDFRFTRK